MPSASAPIRILHLEDDPRDADMIRDRLDLADLACHIVRAVRQDEYDAALLGAAFHLILCDYNLPNYDGLSALKLARERQPDTPVIIISGSLEEEEAVKCLRLGATDYLLKQRLERLVPAVQRALQEAVELKQRQEAETELNRSKDLLQVASTIARMGGWQVGLRNRRVIFSNDVAAIIGMPADTSLTVDDAIHLFAPEHREKIRVALQACITSGAAFDDEFQIVTFQGHRLWVRFIGQPVYNANGEVTGVQGAFQDITEKKQVEQALKRSNQRLTSTLESITDAFFTLDREWRFTYVNKEAERIWRRSQQELLGKVFWDEFQEAIDTAFYDEYHRAVRENCSVAFEEYYPPLGRWFEAHGYPSEEGLTVHFRDVTERRLAAQESARITRALQILSRCNDALTRADTEEDLRQHICQLIINVGGYCVAWIGYARDDETMSVLPMAYAGEMNEIQYIGGNELSCLDARAEGHGPVADVIRTGTAAIIAEFGHDGAATPWTASMRECGFRSVISLPLRDQNRAFGLLALYSKESQNVADEEVKLLQEMADNLAFGISTMRAREERRQLELAAVKVAASISRSTGADFFEQLARNMGEAVGARGGFVARLVLGNPPTMRVIAAVVDGRVVDGFDYPIEGTPCENVLREGHCVVPAAVDQRFPHSASAAFGAEAYVGARLDNALGQAIGVLFVIFPAPLTRRDLITSTLQIFAARAAAELERQDADARIREQASLLDQAKDAIIVRGIDHRVQFWNKGAERLYGWAAEEVIGRSITSLLYRDSMALLAATRCVLEKGEWHGEIIEHRKDGTMLWVEANWTLVRDREGRPQAIFAIKSDITQRKAAEREVQHLAFHDSLTQLPNRPHLLNRLQQALALNRRGTCSGALMLIDLDNFKTLNDTLGHDKGDLLLQQIAKRLQSCVRACDTVARLGGDEFVILLENLNRDIREAASEAKEVSDKIFCAFKQAYDLAGYEHICSPSIGITLFNPSSITADEIMKHADLAMYQAKAAGRNTMRFFDPGMQAEVLNRAALEGDFRQGLQQQEFLLHYQPQCDINGCVTGAEALVRWQNPKRGLVSPLEFIPLAEETGLILPLGRWVLETACTQLVTWATQPETAALSMAVNVSARQFHHPDFVQHVLEVLEATGADPLRLKLELTESLLVKDVDDTIAKMSVLRAKGVSFSLDDFGTGYSSLSYLKRLPLDQLKIDRSFIKDVLSDPDDAVIACTIVTLGQSLGLAVIAEGVETAAQRDFLAEHGCHHYQGYLCSRPLPAEQFKAFMQQTATALMVQEFSAGVA